MSGVQASSRKMHRPMLSHNKYWKGRTSHWDLSGTQDLGKNCRAANIRTVHHSHSKLRNTLGTPIMSYLHGHLHVWWNHVKPIYCTPFRTEMSFIDPRLSRNCEHGIAKGISSMGKPEPIFVALLKWSRKGKIYRKAMVASQDVEINMLNHQLHIKIGPCFFWSWIFKWLAKFSRRTWCQKKMQKIRSWAAAFLCWGSDSESQRRNSWEIRDGCTSMRKSWHPWNTWRNTWLN